jgi:hypothetical protein
MLCMNVWSTFVPFQCLAHFLKCFTSVITLLRAVCTCPWRLHMIYTQMIQIPRYSTRLIPAFSLHEGNYLYPLCCKLETTYTLVAFGQTQCLCLVCSCSSWTIATWRVWGRGVCTPLLAFPNGCPDAEWQYAQSEWGVWWQLQHRIWQRHFTDTERSSPRATYAILELHVLNFCGTLFSVLVVYPS